MIFYTETEFFLFIYIVFIYILQVRGIANPIPTLTLPSVPGSLALAKPNFGAVCYYIDNVLQTVPYIYDESNKNLKLDDKVSLKTFAY